MFGKKRSMRLSALVLTAAALAMVIALAGGPESSVRAGGSQAADPFDLQVLAAASDEARLRLGRTLLQLQGRGIGQVSAAAALSAGLVIGLTLPATGLLPAPGRAGSPARHAMRSPRGPPAD